MNDKIMLGNTVETISGTRGSVIEFGINSDEPTAKVLFRADIFHPHGVSSWYPISSLTKV